MERMLYRNTVGVLLLIALQFILGSVGENPSEDPIPNLEAAMEGYDPVMADPFAFKDPGKRHQILEPVRTTESNGKVVLNSFISHAREDYASSGSSKRFSFTNFNSYFKKETESVSFGVGVGFSIGIGAASVVGFGLSGQTESENMKVSKFFEKVSGEIVQVHDKCRTHSISVDPNQKAVFTREFRSALSKLHYAAKKPTTSQSIKTFVDFVKTFGTHFMTKIELGTKTVFEKRFASRTSSGSESTSRQQCVSAAAERTLGYVSVTTTASVEASFSVNSGKCSSSASGSYNFQHESFSESRVVRIGQVPCRALGRLGSNPKESPVPISFTLEKISRWFSMPWFGEIPVDESIPNGEKLDGAAMTRFFESNLSNYCKVMFERSDCNVKKTGCGYDSNCDFGKECVNTNKKSPSHQCLRANIRYGAVYISGGAANWKDWRGRPYYTDKVQKYMSTTAIKAHYRDVYAHTLTILGSTLYICGGRQRDWRKRTYRTKDCYKYSESQWRRTADLPKELAFHTAVAFDSNIWYIGDNKLYNYDIRMNKFSTTSTPFSVSEGHCSVTSDTHAYVIGVGGGQNEIYETPKHKPTSWKKVGTLKEGKRVNHGCLLFGPNIYITGGRYNRRSVEVFNFVSGAVWKIGSLTQDRLGHQMMEYNGKVAVIGGHYNCNLKCTYHSNLETYNPSTRRWSVDSSFRLWTGLEYFGLAQSRS